MRLRPVETVAVIYTDPTAGVDDRNAIQDSVGNDAASLTESVTNNSTVSRHGRRRALVSAETSTDGGRIVLTFSEVLDSTNGPQGSDFTVTVDETSAVVSSTSPVTVRGRTVVLGLETAVTADQDITVTYTDPTANNDPNAIQDTAGNDVATLADQSVANRVGQRPRPSIDPRIAAHPAVWLHVVWLHVVWLHVVWLHVVWLHVVWLHVVWLHVVWLHAAPGHAALA